MTTECIKPRITLKTLAQATEQEVFDQVVQHLREQGVQSKNENGCAYRGEGGLMCAAGCLIADDEYVASTMDYADDTTWTQLVIDYVVPEEHSILIRRLQEVHDGYSDNRMWEEGFSHTARVFGIAYTLPSNYK